MLNHTEQFIWDCKNLTFYFQGLDVQNKTNAYSDMSNSLVVLWFTSYKHFREYSTTETGVNRLAFLVFVGCLSHLLRPEAANAVNISLLSHY